VENQLAFERFKRKLTIENLWIYILSLLEEEPKYGYEIYAEIRDRYGFKPGKVTSYLVLYRLVQEGYIVLKEERKGGLGPARKYYSITDKGKKLLTQAQTFLDEMQARVFGERT